MPPPTTTTSTFMTVVVVEKPPHDVFECGDERRRGVERRRSPERGSRLARCPRGLDVDVEQDLGVIADKPDGHDHEVSRAALGARRDEIAQVGANPGLRRASGALVRDLVSI